MKKRVMGATAGAMMLAMGFIAPLEGLKLKAYRDSAKIWTICSGHIQGVYEGMTATPAQCKAFFESDVGQAMAFVVKVVKVPLHEWELAAFTSFVFNLGRGNFASSTMLKLVNQGKYEEACRQFPRWKYVAGQDCEKVKNLCPGIPRRRKAEQELCLGGDPWALF